ncbi:unnamed protein product, partial [Larinioides sclopetarius]
MYRSQKRRIWNAILRFKCYESIDHTQERKYIQRYLKWNMSVSNFVEDTFIYN